MAQYEIFLRLLLASLFGGLIGMQREYRQKVAGFRTHTLVCLGAALAMIVSLQMADIAGGGMGDPGRIAAQVISGIGFLGAGAIIREGATVRGLTTAASLWVVAGLGLAVGAGQYSFAAFATALVMLTLTYFGRIEKFLVARRQLHAFFLTIEDKPGEIGLIGSFLGEHQVGIYQIEIMPSDDGSEDKVLVEMQVKIPPQMKKEWLRQQLAELPGVESVSYDSD